MNHKKDLFHSLSRPWDASLFHAAMPAVRFFLVSLLRAFSLLLSALPLFFLYPDPRHQLTGMQPQRQGVQTMFSGDLMLAVRRLIEGSAHKPRIDGF
jgi:hypothetical protein